MLSACTAPYRPDPAKQLEIDRSSMICSSATECELKCGKARQWITENAGYKLRVVTADFVETFSPTGSSSRIGVSVSKQPVTPGVYKIQAKIWCDNMFGCNPDAQDALLSMIKFVNGK